MIYRYLKLKLLFILYKKEHEKYFPVNINFSIHLKRIKKQFSKGYKVLSKLNTSLTYNLFCQVDEKILAIIFNHLQFFFINLKQLSQ